MVYADEEKVLYLNFTSQLGKFAYTQKPLGQELESPEDYHPARAVFLVTDEIKNDSNNNVFSKETVLNCFHPPHKIFRTEFNARFENGILEYKNARLPNAYLVQAVPCATVLAGSQSKWSKKVFKDMLDEQHGIGRNLSLIHI